MKTASSYFPRKFSCHCSFDIYIFTITVGLAFGHFKIDDFMNSIVEVYPSHDLIVYCVFGIASIYYN